MLTLAEEMFLLSIFERKDSIHIRSVLGLPFSLAGAGLMELILSGSVRLEDGRLIPSSAPGQFSDEWLRSTLEKIQRSEKHKKLDYWVYISGMKKKQMIKGLIQSLIEKGLMVEVGNHYQWAPVSTSCDQGQELTKYLLKRKIRDAVYCQSDLPESILTQLVLLDSCTLLDHVFTCDEIIAVRKKIKRLINEGSYQTPNFCELLNRMVKAVESGISDSITN